MRGHVTKRGERRYAFVVDVDGQRAQRCADCNRRTWVERDRPAQACQCGGTLGNPRPERRQVWRSGFTTKRAADQALREYLVSMDKGADPFPQDVDLRTWAERWQAGEAFTKLRPRTRGRYAQVMADVWLAELGTMRVDRIRPRHLRTVLDGIGASGTSPSSVTEAKAIVSSCLARAVDLGLIDVNPAAGVRTSGGRRRTLVVPDAEAATALLRAVEGGTWEVPLALAAYTGMRRSEVLGLRWSCVDLEQQTIRVGEGLHRIRDAGGSRLGFLPTKSAMSEREIVIASGLADRLRKHRAAQLERRLRLGPAWQDLDLVCDRGDGGPFDPDSFSTGFRRAVIKAELPAGIRLHDVRHGVATELLKQGVDPKIVSAMLGHSTVSFTQDQYQHVLRSMTAPAAEALNRALGDR